MFAFSFFKATTLQLLSEILGDKPGMISPTGCLIRFRSNMADSRAQARGREKQRGKERETEMCHIL